MLIIFYRYTEVSIMIIRNGFIDFIYFRQLYYHLSLEAS